MPTELHPAIDPTLLPVSDLDDDVVTLLRETGLTRPEVELSDRVERVEMTVPGEPELTVRVHRPVGPEAAPRPCLFSIHGGGYVMGETTNDDLKFDRWVERFGLVGVSIDYRLAPETPFPGPLEDCYAGLRWVFEHAGELGIDPERVGIIGVSAGGGLCAALALLVRDRAEFAVQYQLLDCPMLDDRMTTASSLADDLIVWSRVSNEYGWRAYLGPLFGADDVPAHAAPARATDLTALPPAYVCVGGADGFRDEDIDYAQRLMAAGVPTELHVYPGVPHGVGFWAGTEPARRYAADQTDWLARQLSAAPSR